MIDNVQRNVTPSAHLNIKMDVSRSSGTDLPEKVALGELVPGNFVRLLSRRIERHANVQDVALSVTIIETALKSDLRFIVTPNCAIPIR